MVGLRRIVRRSSTIVSVEERRRGHPCLPCLPIGRLYALQEGVPEVNGARSGRDIR